MIAVAGYPDCRSAYEQNLIDAERMLAYHQMLVDHPGRGGIGTGSDPTSRRRDLKRALEEVAYRRALLDGLTEKADA